MPHPIFQIVPEDPKEKHIARDMHETAMKELRCYQRLKPVALSHAGRDHGLLRVKLQKRALVPKKRRVRQEDKNVQRDQCVNDKRCAARRAMIADRKHGATLSLSQARVKRAHPRNGLGVPP